MLAAICDISVYTYNISEIVYISKPHQGRVAWCDEIRQDVNCVLAVVVVSSSKFRTRLCFPLISEAVVCSSVLKVWHYQPLLARAVVGSVDNTPPGW